MKLKIWRISQIENKGYETYDSAVVVAETEGQARLIHPRGFEAENAWWLSGQDKTYINEWVRPYDVIVTELGPLENSDFKNGDVIVASYNQEGQW